MEGESGVIGRIIDELHSGNIQVDEMKSEGGLLEVSLMNFILRIFNEIK